jgi:hypothetical protein
MAKVLTPNDIEVLLHYYASGVRHPRANFPAVRDATRYFLAQGMLEPVEADDNGITIRYTTTERGVAHVKQLCSLPLPVRAWVDSTGKIIT